MDIEQISEKVSKEHGHIALKYISPDNKIRTSQISCLIVRNDRKIIIKASPHACNPNTFNFHMLNIGTILGTTKGIATCHKDDKFSYEKGRAIAIRRWKNQIYGAMISDYKACIKDYENDINRVMNWQTKGGKS